MLGQSGRLETTPRSYVVDASVVSKWFNKGEEFEEEADTLREAWATGGVELFSPSLMLFEVANSIWKNPNTPNDVARALVKAAVSISPNLVTPRARVVGMAMSVARKESITFYDAVYLALAKSLSARLITADQKQLLASGRYVKSIHISQLPEVRL